MKRYHRSEKDKIIAGVCGGLAESWHVSPLLLRIGFVIAAMINGVGLVAYLLLWLFMAPEHVEYANTDELVRRNVAEMRERATALGRDAQSALGETKTQLGQGTAPSHKVVLIGAVLVGVGLLALLRNVGLLGWIGRLWPLALVAIGAVLLLNYLKERG
ncbi:MAG: PspC domain-containing protein [Chloroflexota bacterium]